MKPTLFYGSDLGNHSMNTYEIIQSLLLIKTGCIKIKGKARPVIWQKNLQYIQGSQPALHELARTLSTSWKEKRQKDTLMKQPESQCSHQIVNKKLQWLLEGLFSVSWNLQ